MQILAFFRYQDIGIPNAKLWRLGSKPMGGPSANGFASQWNIGFSVKIYKKYLYSKISSIELSSDIVGEGMLESTKSSRPS